MGILIVEDEEKVADFIQKSLREAGYQTRAVGRAADGLQVWDSDKPDLVLLDLMLPDGNGLRLLHDARSRGWTTPVLILSAKGALPDRVEGLDAGADDYLPKPFGVEELLARVRALLRRRSQEEGVYKCGDLELDSRSRRVTRAGRVVFLSATEFTLLELLARNMAKPVSKSEILRYVWDDAERDPNVVEVYVNYLRHKLDRGGAPRLIQTVRGQGYVLKEPES